MAQNPQKITTQIEHDFPGRFIVEIVELKRLISDIKFLLKPETNQKLQLKYWVRLENGILYETEDLETVLKEENSRRLQIKLLIVFAELFASKSAKEPIRRIVVQLSRGNENHGRNSFEQTLEHIRGESFNINYHGLNYRIRDKDRDSALKVITTLEERLSKFQRWYSRGFTQLRIQPQNFAFSVMLTTMYVLLIYTLASALPQTFGYFFVPRFTTDFLRGVAISLIGFIFLGSIMLGIVRLINWLLPSTYFEIGDEIEQRKKEQKTREIVLIGIVLAVIVSIIANLITPFFSSWFINIGVGR